MEDRIESIKCIVEEQKIIIYKKQIRVDKSRVVQKKRVDIKVGVEYD